MRRGLVLILGSLLALNLVACGSEKNPVQESNNNAQVSESNNKIKEAAVQSNFIEINDGKVEGKEVYAEGKVSSVDKYGIHDDNPNFILSQEESEGTGMYLISCLMTKEEFEALKISDGNVVKVYGKVSGTDSTGIPRIEVSIVE